LRSSIDSGLLCLGRLHSEEIKNWILFENLCFHLGGMVGRIIGRCGDR